MTTPLWPTDWLTKGSNRKDSNRATDESNIHVLLNNGRISEHRSASYESTVETLDVWCLRVALSAPDARQPGRTLGNLSESMPWTSSISCGVTAWRKRLPMDDQGNNCKCTTFRGCAWNAYAT